ncbi:MAG: citrate lyase subunit alpha, partial [Acidobacteria bacterium]|nr:citrate lyase subunit alpha [Acidobacteriota bacterium]
MAREADLVQNAAGRRVPTIVNGAQQVPYLGIGKHRPEGRRHAPAIRSCSDYPPGGDKRVASLEEALKRCGLRDGMVISTHHHLRDGDRVALLAL